jgi:hypothetical protein
LGWFFEITERDPTMFRKLAVASALFLLGATAWAQAPNQVTSKPNIFGGFDYSNGVSSRKNIFGGYDYSNGVSSRKNIFGGQDYSNGMSSRENIFGGQDYSFPKRR